MAQENKNVNTSIPDQISWTNTKQEKYRGLALQTRLQQETTLDIVGASPYGKNATHSEAFSIPNDISGGAIDISFNGNSKASYPVIQPMGGGSRIKPSEPIIQVRVQVQEHKESSQSSNSTAPMYDGFQPHYAHYSKTVNPIKMQQTVATILNDLQGKGNIDFYHKSPFVYTGRAFGLYNDCEFLLSIFSDESSECVVEIRRSSGESFEYANVENSILAQLLSIGAIQSSEDDTDNDNDNENENEEYNSNDYYGFGALPSLDTMELDSNFSSTDDDEVKSYFAKEIDLDTAKQLLQNATDSQSMRDVLRSDIAHLNEQMSKNENVFQNVPDIITIIINAINADFYDCWGIKMYLGMISKLISCGTPVPSLLSQSIQSIQTKWSHTVINQVAPGVKFEFYPSQQIIKCCKQIIEQTQQ